MQYESIATKGIMTEDDRKLETALVSIWLLSLIKDKSLIKDSLEGMPKMDFP